MKSSPFLLVFIAFIIQFHPVWSQSDKQGEFQSLFNKYSVEGSVLVYDLSMDQEYGYNLQYADSGFLPASTFKIPNSLIALDTKIIESSSTIIAWDGKPRRMKIWEKNMTFRKAFHLSCVPCYQEIARKVGAERMNDYLKRFQYGQMDVRSENIDLFWLEGEAKISQREQISFLQKLYLNQLDIDSLAQIEMKELMIIKRTENYTLRGKTGWSIQNGNNNGWFVGYYEIDNNVFFVAVNISPSDNEQIGDFKQARRQIAHEALRILGILK
jgi:beta-lactamase class D